MHRYVMRTILPGIFVTALSCGGADECELGESWCDGNTLQSCDDYSGHPCMVPFCQDPVTEIVAYDCTEAGMCMEDGQGARCVMTEGEYCDGNTLIRYDRARESDPAPVHCPEHCVEIAEKRKAYCSPVKTPCDEPGERICMSHSEEDEGDVDAVDADAGTIHELDAGDTNATAFDRVLICNDYAWAVERECTNGEACIEISLPERRHASCE